MGRWRGQFNCQAIGKCLELLGILGAVVLRCTEVGCDTLENESGAGGSIFG